jgi:hypothetical protein
MARFMVYKWLGPFNEMYIKIRQQQQKAENEIILLSLFDDLFAETYRTDNVNRFKKLQNLKEG